MKTHDSHPYEIPCPACGSLAENDPMLPSGSHVCTPPTPATTSGREREELISEGYRAGLLFGAKLCEDAAKVYDGPGGMPALHRCLMVRALEMRLAAKAVTP